MADLSQSPGGVEDRRRGIPGAPQVGLQGFEKLASVYVPARQTGRAQVISTLKVQVIMRLSQETPGILAGQLGGLRWTK